MPAQEVAYLPHDVVLLPLIAGASDGFGQPLVGAPVAIKGRWTYNTSRFNDANGNTVQLAADCIVTQDIGIGARLWKGLLTDFQAAAQGSLTLYEVKLFRKTDDLKGRSTFRIVQMALYGAGP